VLHDRPKKKILRGPLVRPVRNTGVKVEIRNGGPAIGFQQVSAPMYRLTSRFTPRPGLPDRRCRTRSVSRRLAVVAPLEDSPDHDRLEQGNSPGFHTTSRTRPDRTQYPLLRDRHRTCSNLLGAGLVPLQPAVLLGRRQRPSKSSASNGDIAQNAGFATSEPYIFKAEVKGHSYNTDLQLSTNNRYSMYCESLSIFPTPAERQGEARRLPEGSCLSCAVDGRFITNSERDHQLVDQGRPDAARLLDVLDPAWLTTR